MSLPQECIEFVFEFLAPMQRHDCAVDFQHTYLRKGCIEALHYVSLIDTNTDGAIIPCMLKKYGTYFIHVSDMNPRGASSKMGAWLPAPDKTGWVFMAAFTPGELGEAVVIRPSANSTLRLFFQPRPSFTDGTTYSYKVWHTDAHGLTHF